MVQPKCRCGFTVHKITKSKPDGYVYFQWTWFFEIPFTWRMPDYKFDLKCLECSHSKSSFILLSRSVKVNQPSQVIGMDKYNTVNLHLYVHRGIKPAFLLDYCFSFVMYGNAYGHVTYLGLLDLMHCQVLI